MAAEFGGNGVFLGELEGTKATKGTQKAPGTARISGGAAVKTGLEELYSGCFSRWARTTPGGPGWPAAAPEAAALSSLVDL